jgi:predicted small metal-binding protein
MVHKLIAGVLMVVLVFGFATTAFAQDAKKDMKKEQKAAVLKSASCDPSCGFMVRSHNEKEIVSIMKTHAKKMHKMDMTDQQVKDMMKTEEAK